MRSVDRDTMDSCVSVSGKPVSVAIIIPSYNRPDKLQRCLGHLAQLEGGPYRTIVVDDGGRQPLDAVCAPYADWVQLIRQANAGPAAARNRGAREATGADVVAFLDDDCAPHCEWLCRLVRAQGGVPDRLVGGRVDNGLPDNICSSVSQSLCSYLYQYYQTSGSDMTFFTSNNMCARREDFLARGGFSEDFALAAGEDRDFGIRWRDEGGELVYAPNAAIDHAHHLTLGKFWRQHSNYGRGARQLHLTMDRRGDSRTKLERAAFYVGMFTYPFRIRSRRPVTEMALVGVSQVAMVVGYARAMLAERGRASA